MQSRIDVPFVIKVCGITNEEDAMTAINAGANALGFNFYRRSPRYVSAEVARRIVESVPGDYLRVGIFVSPAVDEVTSAVNAAALDVVQLHGNECPTFPDLCVWKAVEPNAELARYFPAQAYLFDTPSEAFGGSGKIFDWKLAARSGVRTLIAGGLDFSNVAEAIATASPWGVDACSRLELSAGIKDPRKVREFVSAAREAFHVHSQQKVLI
jgi:phosphoribosylanthranilate isomerase